MSQSLNSGPFRKMDGEQSGGPKSGTWSLHAIDTCVKESAWVICSQVNFGFVLGMLSCFHPAGSQYAHNS